MNAPVNGWPYVPLAEWHARYAETMAAYDPTAEAHRLVSVLLSLAYDAYQRRATGCQPFGAAGGFAATPGADSTG